MKKSILMLGLATMGQLSFTGCTDANSGDPIDPIDSNAVLYKEVLSNEADNVITETYKSLYNNSTTLKMAVENLTIGDEVALTAVKDAWVATRSPWEKSEGFLYGPVDSDGIDPAIDSWPVNVNDINSILNSNEVITSSLLESNNEARGFHTIEYFVWGLDSDKMASEFTVRELEYLLAATENLESKTEQLFNDWTSAEGNFAGNFTNAGQAGSIFASQKVALTELVDGLITIADEVGNGKIETPLNGNGGSAMPEAEESRFSNNSKLDFADNIRSIQNIYLGDYNGLSGKGLTDIIVSSDPVLDTNIKKAITDAINAITEIPGTFTNAIEDNRADVENAQTKVGELQTILQTSLKPLVTNL